MGGEEIIELSVEETNALRAKLGLAPLRGVGGDGGNTGRVSTPQQHEPPESSSEKVLELSVDDTNDLREKLGLAPLRVSNANDDETGKSARLALHKPAENVGESKELQERLEKARLEREVQRGISSKFAVGSLADHSKQDASDALSWAAKMRAQKTEAPKATKSRKTGRKSKKTEKGYDEEDLKGMNVAHNLADLDAGSTTIMTLADAPLLKTKDETNTKVVGLNEEEQLLENVELTSQQKQRDGLRKKRQLELGMGRAGGYAGFDDDEFEELSGAMGPSRAARVQGGVPTEKKSNAYGFQIGDAVNKEKQPGSDLFASYEGRGISLEPAQADVTASDFLTAEEDTAMLKNGNKRKKDAKFKKKKKKEKKNHRKKDLEDKQEEPATSKGFLDELEATAVKKERPSKRNRRRADSETDAPAPDSEMTDANEEDAVMGEEDTAKKRARFEATMAKGNARTAEAFKVITTSTPTAVDDEPDDAFLNAALAKARRLRRLKEMSTKETNRGAAVAQALQKSREESRPEESSEAGGVTFAVDDTREFTRALQARAEQAERQQAKKAKAMAKKIVSTTVAKKPEARVEAIDEQMPDDKDEEGDIADLAKEIKEDDVDFEGTTANTVSVGRGLSNVLSLLRQTGEITGKNAGKEELRGRSKDERNYENYEALDLSKVVKIGPNATDKDKELASREVKLEYRDSHGRLLTTKEAWRNLCYDFHGHGSSLKNQERKLRQIAREQAEARLASSQVANDSDKPAGSLGALKATQRATGKAFVVHKT
jgi:U4/U6.U5 tri-snRNP-associated protein 1